MIYVYTQPDCRPCKRTIQLFEDAGLNPLVVDLSKNPFAADYVKRVLKAQSTPVVEDDETGEFFIGYKPELIKEWINARA